MAQQIIQKNSIAIASPNLSVDDALRPDYIDQHHWQEWLSSGVNPEIIRRNVRSIHDSREVDRVLNRNAKRRTKHSDHLVPCWEVTGLDPLGWERSPDGVQVKPDIAPIGENGKEQKYLGASEYGTSPLFLETEEDDYWLKVLKDTSIPIIITEGGKKAGAGLSIDHATISIPGVSTCRKLGNLHEKLAIFAKIGRTIYLGFDNDAMTKEPVQKALWKLGCLLASLGAKVMVIVLPPGECKGMDDFIAANGKEEFDKLVNEALTVEEWKSQLQSHRPTGRNFSSGGNFGGSGERLPTDSDRTLEKDPNVTFLQQAVHYLYGDKPWISADGKLYSWVGTHYKYSPDAIERPKIAAFCNSFLVETEEGKINYPFAKPSKVREVLQWVKDRFEVNPDLLNPAGLNCTNGVLQIQWLASTPSWKLIPHDPLLYYTYEPVVTYDPLADPENCDRLLSVLDKPQQEIFLRTIAASLDLATVRRHKGRLVRGLLLKGDGNNGKDSLREVVAAMYGFQGMTGCTLSDFKAYDDGRKFPLSRLRNSRVNWATENALVTALDKLQSIKAFLTGDTLSSEGKGKDEFDYNPAAVGLFNVNDTPNLRGTLEAIASRWGILSFNKTFKIGADPIKGEIEADPRFKYDPKFMRASVLPAFLNRALQSLVDLMEHGIDYSCTQQALEDVQRENSHLFQFCHDVGLSYDPTAVMTAGQIWDLLKPWYEDNGTLEYEEGNNGKRKAIWNEQPRKYDLNVKHNNQVIARFSALFPKAKIVTVQGETKGKPRMALLFIGITPVNLNSEKLTSELTCPLTSEPLQEEAVNLVNLNSLGYERYQLKDVPLNSQSASSPSSTSTSSLPLTNQVNQVNNLDITGDSRLSTRLIDTLTTEEIRLTTVGELAIAQSPSSVETIVQSASTHRHKANCSEEEAIANPSLPPIGSWVKVDGQIAQVIKHHPEVKDRVILDGQPAGTLVYGVYRASECVVLTKIEILELGLT